MLSSFTMVHGNILWCTFEHLSNTSHFPRNKNESFKPKNSRYDFKKHSVLAQTISFLYNSAYSLNAFLTILTAFWNISVSKTMVYTSYFEEVYRNIRNQSGCFFVKRVS